MPFAGGLWQESHDVTTDRVGLLYQSQPMSWNMAMLEGETGQSQRLKGTGQEWTWRADQTSNYLELSHPPDQNRPAAVHGPPSKP